MTSSHEERLQRARLSLEGLSVGDAFGECFFRERYHPLMDSRELPEPMWYYTDDTNMALSVYHILSKHHAIQQDDLALSFAEHYSMLRGYGASMHGFLARIKNGASWRTEATNLFDGRGSFGNGASMRVAPLGAYFADDLNAVIEQARCSAEITHANPEGISGAIAVAVAAAIAWKLKQDNQRPTRQAFIDMVFPYIPAGVVSEKVRHARNLAPGSSLMLATSALGNGSQISAQDTVPLALWLAGEYLDNYEEALWQTVTAFGDIDTNCAIVGGIVSLYTGAEGIPAAWIERREPLPEWALGTV